MNRKSSNYRYIAQGQLKDVQEKWRIMECCRPRRRVLDEAQVQIMNTVHTRPRLCFSARFVFLVLRDDPCGARGCEAVEILHPDMLQMILDRMFILDSFTSM
jgi:hypothetical protein